MRALSPSVCGGGRGPRDPKQSSARPRVEGWRIECSETPKTAFAALGVERRPHWIREPASQQSCVPVRREGLPPGALVPLLTPSSRRCEVAIRLRMARSRTRAASRQQGSRASEREAALAKGCRQLIGRLRPNAACRQFASSGRLLQRTRSSELTPRAPPCFLKQEEFESGMHPCAPSPTISSATLRGPKEGGSVHIRCAAGDRATSRAPP